MCVGGGGGEEGWIPFGVMDKKTVLWVIVAIITKHILKID